VATYSATLIAGRGPTTFGYEVYKWTAGGKSVVVGEATKTYIETLINDDGEALFAIVVADPDGSIILVDPPKPVGFVEMTFEGDFDECPDVSGFTSSSISVNVPFKRWVLTKIDLTKIAGDYAGALSGNFFFQVSVEATPRSVEPMFLFGDALPAEYSNGEMVFVSDDTTTVDLTLEYNIFGPAGESLQVRATLTVHAFVEV